MSVDGHRPNVSLRFLAGGLRPPKAPNLAEGALPPQVPLVLKHELVGEANSNRISTKISPGGENLGRNLAPHCEK